MAPCDKLLPASYPTPPVFPFTGLGISFPACCCFPFQQIQQSLVPKCLIPAIPTSSMYSKSFSHGERGTLKKTYATQDQVHTNYYLCIEGLVGIALF